jgi:hypothetical protein
MFISGVFLFLLAMYEHKKSITIAEQSNKNIFLIGLDYMAGGGIAILAIAMLITVIFVETNVIQ